ncbi:MAG: shikimate dehydrogenase [Paenibacillaceae bacterium]|jgi:shikimate dehydrogenase|nr:shikimate dehydrogenase [Paenibacillaceae bacterium]
MNSTISIDSHVTIDSHTVMYGVFGDPVAHSKSPIMLNRAFRECGLNAAYAAFHIKPGQLKEAVQGVRALGFRGVNVTIPHKEEVMLYLDEIDAGAREIGAVNTIVNEQGRLIGYNTDGIGYVRSLREETGLELAGRRILFLGAGGAARGVLYALAKQGPARITIANRTLERARQLALDMGKYADTSAVGLDELSGLASMVGECDLVVNNTPVGMSPNVDGTPLPASLIQPHMVVSDIVYTPLHTRLLSEAETAGARIHSGLGMFVYQGAYAFEYWTGQPAPIAAMRDTVMQALAVR